MTPAGEYIPEDGPNRCITTLHIDLYNPEIVASPVFPSVEG